MAEAVRERNVKSKHKKKQRSREHKELDNDDTDVKPTLISICDEKVPSAEDLTGENEFNSSNVIGVDDKVADSVPSVIGSDDGKAPPPSDEICQSDIKPLTDDIIGSDDRDAQTVTMDPNISTQNLNNGKEKYILDKESKVEVFSATEEISDVNSQTLGEKSDKESSEVEIEDMTSHDVICSVSDTRTSSSGDNISKSDRMEESFYSATSSLNTLSLDQCEDMIQQNIKSIADMEEMLEQEDDKGCSEKRYTEEERDDDVVVGQEDSDRTGVMHHRDVIGVVDIESHRAESGGDVLTHDGGEKEAQLQDNVLCKDGEEHQEEDENEELVIEEDVPAFPLNLHLDATLTDLEDNSKLTDITNDMESNITMRQTMGTHDTKSKSVENLGNVIEHGDTTKVKEPAPLTDTRNVHVDASECTPNLVVIQEHAFVKQKGLTMEQLQSLYYNSQLARNAAFIDNFVQNEKKKDHHEFHEILLSYLRARKNLLQSENEVQVLQESYTQMKEQAWVTVKQSVNARGPCGDGAMCKSTHLYDAAEFSDETFDNMKKTLSKIRENLQSQLVLHAYSSQLARLQVESYIHALFTSSPLLRDIPNNAPVQACEYHRHDIQHQITRLRECISVAFTFHRRPVSDKEFNDNMRSWTQRLVSALLRVASFDDHMFILNHILRCPAGVSQWAVSLIQVPSLPLTDNQSSFGSPILDHFITCLSTILTPIKERESFICLMKEAVTPDPKSQGNNWIMVDSDGEEDDDPQHAWQYLHENDFVAILNQFPMAEVFKHVLLLCRKDNDTLLYDPTRTTDGTFLKLIAFCTCLVNILGCGLHTYNLPRYKQLNKRLGKSIRTTVQYVSDHLENFLTSHMTRLSGDVLNRLQLEYNRFFLRATSCILSAHRLGSWQFMVNMPYSTVSAETMWQLLWLQHQGRNNIVSLEELPSEEECKKFVADPDSKNQLADVINCLPTSEVIYLLTALANMAQSRKAHEIQFIEAIAFDLFEICYVCIQTRESCSKVGRELLVSVAIAHPFILSLLIQGTKTNMETIGMMAIYLFRELPFHLWLPCDTDLAVIRHWLLNFDLSQPQNQLARNVLSKVNWGIDHLTNRLFVPHEVHVQIAVLLTEAYGHFITNKQMGFFFFEGVKQVASAVRQQSTNEQVFNNWAWEIAMKLHLHRSTLPSGDYQSASENVPVLAKESSLMPVFKGLKDKNAMACFMSIALSEFGHIESSFVTEGVEELLIVIQQHHYQPTFHCLNLIFPMFIDKQSYLTMHESFLEIIQFLLTADDSYTKVSKMIWSHDFPGPITKFFSCMIQNQVHKLNMTTPDGSRSLQLLSLWIQLLTNDTKWYLNKNTCYLLDDIIKAAFPFKNGLVTMETAFQDAFQKHISEGQSHNAVSTFVSWVATGVSYIAIPSLMEKITSPDSWGWLGYLILDLESKKEEETGLWRTLKDEIHSDSKQSMEQAMKKTVNKLKLDHSPSVNSLCIFQWSKLALGLNTDHPVLLLVWQRFFGLFLGRQVTQISMQQRASIGEKCFEHSKHSSDLKKMKKRLGETVDFHINFQPKNPNSSSQGYTGEPSDYYYSATGEEDFHYESSKEFHLELSRMFQTFQFWVQEPMLHDAKLYLPALPQQYQSDRLLDMFQNQTAPWMEFVDKDFILFEVAQLAKEWDSRLPDDENKSRCQHLLQPIVSAKDRIMIRFQHHDLPVGLPTLQPLKALVPEIATSIMEDKSAIMHLLKSDLNVIKEYAKSFHSGIAKHVANDEDFCGFLPQLYYNKPKQVKVTIECKSLINPLHKCSNPAVVNVNIREKSVDEIIQRQIDENRAENKQLMIEGLSPPPLNVCVAAVHVENAITLLVKLFRNATDNAKLLNDIACTLFYHMAEMVDEDVEFYPPGRQFFTACIDLLGTEFIEKDPAQTEIILQFSFNSPTMASLMSQHFVPINNPYTYVTMYERLVQILQQQNPDLVFMLLTKFDIGDWLNLKSPTQIEIKRFLDILGSGLCSCGVDPDTKHNMVFEIYLRHLEKVICYQFPTYVNHTLSVLLRGTASQQIHVRTWKILHQQCFHGDEPSPPSNQSGDEGQTGREEILENHVTTSISISQLTDLLQMLGSSFFQLRTSSSEFGNFGLYPKLVAYVPYLKDFLKDNLMCLVDKIMLSISDISPEQTLEMLWNTTIQTFSPWIQPIQTEASPLLPWIQADMVVGSEMVSAFTDVLLYVHQRLSNMIAPYQRDVLTRLWFYFTERLCLKTTPPHITNVLNSQFERLPWKQLKPNFDVLESMMKVKECNSKESFDLLSHIVCEMEWTDILHSYQQFYPGEGHSRVLGYLLVLLIQCYGDQKHIEIPSLEQRTITAEMYDWRPLSSDSFRHASNWFLQTCDPKCILSERSSSIALGLRLLKSASGFSVQASMQWSSDLSVKRQCYVHSVVQLMCQCTFQADVNLESLSTILINLLTEIETVTSSVIDTQMQSDETLNLVKEVFGLLNNCNPESDSLSVVMKTLVDWLQSSPSSNLLMPCVRAASRCLASHKQIVQIVEECIHVYFKGGLDKKVGGGWDHVLAAIQIPDLNVDEFLDTALEEGSYLLLYGYVIQRLPLCQELKHERVLIHQLLGWIGKAKPSQENECKLLLLWDKCLELSIRQIDFGCEHGIIIKPLTALVNCLHSFGEDRASGGLLGAIGLGKRSVFSPVFRIVSRSLSAMISLQILNDSKLRLQATERMASSSLSKAELGALQSMKNNKAYNQYKSEIQTAWDFVQNPAHSLRESLGLIVILSSAFYSDKEYLSIIHNRSL